MTTRALALGFAVCTALPVLFGLALLTHENTPPLFVVLPAGAAHSVVTNVPTAVPQFQIGPPEVLTRVVVEDWQPNMAPGLWLRTFRATWGKRWIEETTFPALIGPFHGPDDFVCGYQVGISASVLDTNANAKPLVDALTQALKLLPLDVDKTITEYGQTDTFKFKFPPIRNVSLVLPFFDGFIRPRVRVELEDGSFIEGAAKLRLMSKGGAPVVATVGQPETSYDGPTFERLRAEAKAFGEEFGKKLICSDNEELKKDVEQEVGFVKNLFYVCKCTGECGSILGDILGFFFPGLGQLAGQVAGRVVDDFTAQKFKEKGAERASKKIDHDLPTTVRDKFNTAFTLAVAQLNSGLQGLTNPMAPFGEGEPTRIAFRLGGDALIDPSGIRADLCMKWMSPPAAAPAQDVPGPLAQQSERLPPLTLAAGLPMMRVRATPDALNQLLWGVWRAGKLRELGDRSSLLAILDENTRQDINKNLQMLAFEVTGVNPKLPPVVTASEGTTPKLLLGLADAQIGTFDGRPVIAHAQGELEVQQYGDQIDLAFTLKRVAVNCYESGVSSMRLLPCLSDLLPPLRQEMLEKRVSKNFAATDILGQFPLVKFPNMPFKLSDLRVATVLPGPSLDVSVMPSFDLKELATLLKNLAPQARKTP